MTTMEENYVPVRRRGVSRCSLSVVDAMIRELFILPYLRDDFEGIAGSVDSRLDIAYKILDSVKINGPDQEIGCFDIFNMDVDVVEEFVEWVHKHRMEG